MSNQNPFAPAPEPNSALGRLRILSSTAGIRVSPLQLGAMSLGEAWGYGMGFIKKEDAFKLLDGFIDLGGNFIDTANNYHDGESEIWIGEWMASRENRDHVVLATKYSFDHRAHEVGKGKVANYSGNHKKSIRLSVDASLKKLQTSYIDILYVHWWDFACSVKEIMDGLHMLVEQGKVLYLGISDTPAWIVAVANEYAMANGKTPFSVYQGHWNVMLRDFERDIIPMARHYGMALAPWGVTGSGKFQSKSQVEERKKGGDGLRAIHGSEQSEEEIKISAALENVARQIGDVNVQAVAIAYVMAKTPRVFPVIGGRKLEQLKENVKALEIRLTKEQIQELEGATKFDLGFPLNFLGADPKDNGGKPGTMLAMSATVEYPEAEKPVGYA